MQIILNRILSVGIKLKFFFFFSEYLTLNWPVQVEASFKRPLFMPGKARVHCNKCGPQTLEFGVSDVHSGVPHLVGKVQSNYHKQ